MTARLKKDFYIKDTVTVAKELIGKSLVRRFSDGTLKRYIITETEAYCGEEDMACHASKGRTPRTDIMYHEGGVLYVYLIYGMYWMLNIVTGPENYPAAVLIRGINLIKGSGKTGKELKIDKSFYGENTFSSDRIWIEDAPTVQRIETAKRIGIDYSGEIWKNMPWRFILIN